MTFETDQTCVKCPYAVYGGSVLFRSCSLSNRNSVEGGMFIECLSLVSLNPVSGQ